MSALLSVARWGALVTGLHYSGYKISQIESKRKEWDAVLLAEWDKAHSQEENPYINAAGRVRRGILLFSRRPRLSVVCSLWTLFTSVTVFGYLCLYHPLSPSCCQGRPGAQGERKEVSTWAPLARASGMPARINHYKCTCIYTFFPFST